MSKGEFAKAHMSNKPPSFKEAQLARLHETERAVEELTLATRAAVEKHNEVEAELRRVIAARDAALVEMHKTIVALKMTKGFDALEIVNTIPVAPNGYYNDNLLTDPSVGIDIHVYNRRHTEHDGMLVLLVRPKSAPTGQAHERLEHAATALMREVQRVEAGQALRCAPIPELRGDVERAPAYKAPDPKSVLP